MIGPEHAEIRHALGLYALGRLSAEETQTVRGHLDGCPACRGELAELAPTAELLARVDLRHLEDSPTPPSGLGRAVQERVARERRRRRTVPGRTVAAVAAAVALVALGGVGGWSLRPVPPVPPTTPAQVETRPGTPVVASAELIDHTWGLEVVLDAQGFDEGERYEVLVVEDDGDVSTAGAFVGTGSREMLCRLNSGVLLRDAVAFEVLDSEDVRVARGTWG
ncbi:anti-sigma factor family protein [Auraticoccus monumenti]|uniref:Anti-sigma-K factor rskA n=1 Tax=Auraticoccus monumenti TaxID=675864 RepID=A0A1G6XL64_9ACTN|nr:zf-HC2 domain-containing protein [Auraticoccus monumenti]SDD78503.1 Anti-sigma-K factor rskA [Auraticoccus monumenti]